MSTEPSSPFHPAAGLGDSHLQTLAGALLRPRGAGALRRERWELPDGDFLDIDRLPASPEQPHVLVLHGLEGSSRSGYVLATLKETRRRGWGAVGFNFRSCSGEPNRLFRSYSSGETADPLWVLHRIRELGVTGPLIAVGFSLGGNVLLKLMAEAGDDCPLTAAAAISPPYNLASCADALDQAHGLTLVYRGAFLRSLKKKTLAKASTHPEAVDFQRVREARTIRAFDDAVTAPAYGFRDAAEYYARCSSGPMLGRIRRPTWLLSAADDPMVPIDSLPDRIDSNPLLKVTVTHRGGHVGFIGGSLLHPRFWAEAQAVAFLEARLNQAP